MRRKRTPYQKFQDELDKLCGDIVKERDGHRCRRCRKRVLVYWAHLIRRSRSKAVRWNLFNGIALCRDCHFWFDSSADKIEAALFIESMIGKEKMVELNELAHDKNAKPWLISDLKKKKVELTDKLIK